MRRVGPGGDRITQGGQSMRTRTVTTVLFCGVCLLAAGYTAGESTPTDSAGTVKPAEGATSAGTQGQEAQGEPPSGEIQERAIRGQGKLAPAIPASPPPPGGARVPLPTPGGPTPQNAPPTTYVGPTDNITRVARAIAVQHKSLTIQVTVKPGLELTQPVTISIGYFPSGVVDYGQYCQQRVTHTYATLTGNTFLCALPEGDGKPRHMHLDINLSEPNPGGQGYSYNVPVDRDLDPLYDVTIGALQFTLLNDCDLSSESEIYLDWIPPDGGGKHFSFNTRGGRMTTIDMFVWARAEVSASAHLLTPAISFWEKDSILEGPGNQFDPGFPSSNVSLIPGKTQTLYFNLKERTGQICSAYVQYIITYLFRSYPAL